MGAMARYLITIEDGEGVERLYVDLAGPDEARRDATVAAAEMIANRPEALLRSGPWRMIVTDDADRQVLGLEMRAT
jgi:hypothetical protein